MIWSLFVNWFDHCVIRCHRHILIIFRRQLHRFVRRCSPHLQCCTRSEVFFVWITWNNIENYYLRICTSTTIVASWSASNVLIFCSSNSSILYAHIFGDDFILHLHYLRSYVDGKSWHTSRTIGFLSATTTEKTIYNGRRSAGILITRFDAFIAFSLYSISRQLTKFCEKRQSVLILSVMCRINSRIRMFFSIFDSIWQSYFRSIHVDSLAVDDEALRQKAFRGMSKFDFVLSMYTF